MNNTEHLDLKKPDYTDFADIFDINDNMDIIDEAVHDTKDSTATFTSSDVADGSANAWTTIAPMASGETHKSLLGKISQALKNLRFLWKLIGNTDISAIGNGTITNALSVLNANGVKNITRSGTTFTVTRNDDTTFTFEQQDNDTWIANSASAAGYVAKGVANKVWKCDANGAPAWRDDANTTYGLASTSANGLLRQLNGSTANYLRGDGTWQTPPNTTYGLASTSANGLLRQLNGSTSNYLRGDGTWQTPPNTNTWRGIQNNLSSTSTTDSLSAAQGKALNDNKIANTSLFNMRNWSVGSGNVGVLTNANSGTRSGLYVVQSTASNWPTTEWGMMLVLEKDGGGSVTSNNWIYQFAIIGKTKKIYMRTAINSTSWSGWTTLI